MPAIEVVRPKTAIVHIDVEERAGWEWQVLVTADEHIDSPHCQRRLLRKHMQQCMDRGAGHIGVGDFFDVMQGKDDRRSRLSDLMEKHKETPYLDLVVNDGASFMAPFRGQLLTQSEGNHEASVKTRHGHDMTAALVTKLTDMGDCPLVQMPYQGWIFVRCHAGKRRYHTTRIAYHHGHGGGGEVTHGAIQAQRRAVILPDADVVLSGHIHRGGQFEHVRERVTAQGRTYCDTQWHLTIPTYKMEYETGDGWWVETGKGPRPLGGWWLRWYWDRGDSCVKMSPPVRTEQ